MTHTFLPFVPNAMPCHKYLMPQYGGLVLINLSKVLKRVYQEAKVSDLFPITHLNTPSIFESQSGFVGAVLRVSGVPFEIEDPDTLNHQKFLLHQALLGLDSRFIVYVTTHRQKQPAN